MSARCFVPLCELKDIAANVLAAPLRTTRETERRIFELAEQLRDLHGAGEHCVAGLLFVQQLRLVIGHGLLGQQDVADGWMAVCGAAWPLLLRELKSAENAERRA